VIAGLVLALQAQWMAVPANPHVGDTVRLERDLPVETGAEARVPPLEASSMLEPLGEPMHQIAEGRIRLLYHVALFEVGRRAVAMPDVELLAPDGTVRTVFGDTAWVNVVSVLPQDGDRPPPARASMGPVARPPTSPMPAIALAVTVLGLVGAWAVARRRVGARPARQVASDGGVTPPLDRWAGAGELRAVAATVADRLRERIARLEPRAGRHLDTRACLKVLEDLRPEWPLRDLGSVLGALERACFAPAVPGDTVILVDDAERVLAHLGRELA